MWIASPKSGYVHTEDCEFGEMIFEREEFDELWQALSAGFHEAGCCGTDRPHSMYVQAQKQRKAQRNRLKEGGCLVCGEKRAVDLAHKLPAALGGACRMPLCPTHHRLFDEGLMTSAELVRLPAPVHQYHGAVRDMR